jgi:outer membrane protein TolC
MTSARKILVGLGTVFLGGAVVAAGDGGPPLSLKEAVEIALAGNHRIGAAEAGARAAEAGLDEARSRRWPRVDLTETYSRTTNPVYVFSNKLGQEAFGPADFDPDRLNDPDALNNWRSEARVELPLWTAGRIGNAVEAAGHSRDAADSDRERTRQEVIFQVVDAYTGAVLARSHLAVAREALETARAHTKIVSDLKEAGLVVQSDLLQARVRETEMEEAVILAEAGVAVSDSAINLALGRDLDTPFTLPKDLNVAREAGVSLAELESHAASNRPDLKRAESRVLAAERMERVEQGGYLPELGLTGMYEANAEDFIGSDGSNWSVFVGLKWTAFDGRGTRARVQKAREQAEQARRMRSLLGQSAGLEIRQAWHDLEAARKRIDRAGRAAEMSRESLRIVQDRYREGLTTLVELLDAQTRLTEARMREVAATRDAILASARLDLAAGRL